MDDRKGEPDGKAGDHPGRGFLGAAEDDHQEDKGGNDFEDKGRDEVELAEIAGAPAVLTQAVCGKIITGLAGGNEVEDARAEEGRR